MLWLPFPDKINAYFCVSLLASLNGVKPAISFTTRKCIISMRQSS